MSIACYDCIICQDVATALLKIAVSTITISSQAIFLNAD